MKKRNLKQLTANERVTIIHGSIKHLHSFKDIAAQHHVSASLVGRLVKDFKAEGTLFKKKRATEDHNTRVNDSLEEVVKRLL